MIYNIITPEEVREFQRGRHLNGQFEEFTRVPSFKKEYIQEQEGIQSKFRRRIKFKWVYRFLEIVKGN